MKNFLLLVLLPLLGACYGSPETHTAVTVSTGGAPFIKFFAKAPTTPPGPTTVPVSNPDKTDFNARDNVTYLLSVSTFSKTQRISKSNVHIRSASPSNPQTRLTWQGKWQSQALVFTAQSHNCSVEDLTIAGHDGAEFVHVEGATGFSMRNVTTRKSPTGGRITPLTVNSSTDLTAENIQTPDGLARYGIYFGWAKGSNTNFIVRGCNLGPCFITESPSTSGRPKTGLNGGAFYEAPCRVYGADTGLIDGCTFTNPNNVKNSLKIMNGKNVMVQNTILDGPVRNGRDVNDPPSYTLSGVNYRNCQIKDYFQIDPGANVAAFGCDITGRRSGQAIRMFGDGHLYLQDTATHYSGSSGSFTNHKSQITVGPNVTFNGKQP